METTKKSNMTRVMVCNENTCVVLFAHEWDTYLKRAKYSNTKQSIESFARGLVLSDICRKFDKFELMKITPRPEPITDVDESKIKNCLVHSLLLQSPYGYEVVNRYFGGHRLSENMLFLIQGAFGQAQVFIENKTPEYYEAKQAVIESENYYIDLDYRYNKSASIPHSKVG